MMKSKLLYGIRALFCPSTSSGRALGIFLLTAYCFTIAGMDSPSRYSGSEAETPRKKWHSYVVLPTQAFVCDMAYSHDGAHLAVGRCRHWTTKTNVNEIYIFDTKTWKRTIVKSCPNATAFAYSSDDRSLAVSCNAQETKIFNTETWQCKKRLEHMHKLAASMLYSPNNEQLVLELRVSPHEVKSKVCIFDTKTWVCRKIFYYDVEIDSIQYSADSGTLRIKFELARQNEIFDTKHWEPVKEPIFAYHEILPQSLSYNEDENIPDISKQDLKDMQVDCGYKLTAMEWTPDCTQIAMGLVRSKDGAEDYTARRRGHVAIFVRDIPTTDQQAHSSDQEVLTPKQHRAHTTPPGSRVEKQGQGRTIFTRLRKGSLATKDPHVTKK